VHGHTNAIRLHIYKQLLATSVAPTPAETAAALDLPVTDVESAYTALATDRSLVLQPRSTDVWMAMPFSNVPTSFTVICRGRAYYANCAWDAFGVAAAMKADAQIVTECPDCRTPIESAIKNRRPQHPNAVVHFLLPVRDWWQDIGYT
jgi:hypothetical protein